MFELMKQMKQCIDANPNEAKTLLTTNPQLAYALLQAQVVMRIVDPQVAMTLLDRTDKDVIPSLTDVKKPVTQPQQQLQRHFLFQSGAIQLLHFLFLFFLEHLFLCQ